MGSNEIAGELKITQRGRLIIIESELSKNPSSTARALPARAEDLPVRGGKLPVTLNEATILSVFAAEYLDTHREPKGTEEKLRHSAATKLRARAEAIATGSAGSTIATGDGVVIAEQRHVEPKAAKPKRGGQQLVEVNGVMIAANIAEGME